MATDRRQFLDSADTIATFAAEMGEFLKTSELTETKAFVRSFVKEIVVKPGRAAIVYTIPTPDDSPAGGADAVEIALNGGVMNSVRHGGLGRSREASNRIERVSYSYQPEPMISPSWRITQECLIPSSPVAGLTKT